MGVDARGIPTKQLASSHEIVRSSPWPIQSKCLTHQTPQIGVDCHAITSVVE